MFLKTDNLTSDTSNWYFTVFKCKLIRMKYSHMALETIIVTAFNVWRLLQFLISHAVPYCINAWWLHISAWISLRVLISNMTNLGSNPRKPFYQCSPSHKGLLPPEQWSSVCTHWGLQQRWELVSISKSQL